jgi:predicted permease
MRPLDRIQQDLAAAFRVIRRSPVFAIAAAAMLAIGIGANTAIFTLINAVLLAPLPYPRADRIVQMWLTGQGGSGLILSLPEINLLAQQRRVFQDFAAYDFGGPGVNIIGAGEPEQVKAIHVSRNYFRLFGARLQMGRSFSADEDLPNGGRVVVISHALWERRFNAERDLTGRTILLGNEPYLVTGILAADFQPDPPAEVWLPLQATPNSTGQAHYLRAAARLAEGLTVEQANASLKLTAVEFRRRFPLFNPNAFFEVKPLRETNAHEVRTALLVSFGAVVLVLLIACSNVSSLLLARGVARRREVAIRAAMGASKVRLLSQLLMESLVLSISGGVLGLALGSASLRALLRFYPEAVPGGRFLSLDWRVFAFAVAISLSATLLFGLLPALRSSRASLVQLMVEGDVRSGTSRGALATKSLLVVFQIALSMMLVIGAGLMLRTFASLRHTAPGLDPQGVLTMQMSIQGTHFTDTASVTRLAEAGVSRLKQVPGVIAAATTWTLPVENAFSSNFIIDGRPLTRGIVHGGMLMRPVSPEFTAVFRIPILRGRFFTDWDTSGGSVAVISQSMAKKYWPHGNPIGERITIDKYLGPDFAWPLREIVGVVGDVRDLAMNKEPMPIVYIPQDQVPNGMTRIDAGVLPLTWAIRTSVEPYLLRTKIQDALREASGGLAVAGVRSMKEVVSQSNVRSDFMTILLTAFAGISLLLAAIGIYGLMVFSVTQRKREIGIRVALGATSDRVAKMVLWQGIRLALAGIVLGILLSFDLARYMQTLIYGVKPTDPAVILESILALSIVAAVSCFVPAFRASRLDPMVALRNEYLH